MGSKLTLSNDEIKNSKPQILLTGWKNSGKTTVENQIIKAYKLEESNYHSGEVNFFEFENFIIYSWSLDSKNHIDNIDKWFNETDAVILVIDSSDETSIENTHNEFNVLINNEALDGVPFLILVNKFDLPNAKDNSFIKEKFKIEEHIENRCVYLEETVASDFSTYKDGLECLIYSFNKQ